MRAGPAVPLIVAAATAILLVLVPLEPAGDDANGPPPGWDSLPVQAGGRLQPLDSYARNTLLLLGGREQPPDFRDRTLAPAHWLWLTLFFPREAGDLPVFRVEHPDLLLALGIDRPAPARVSWNEVAAVRHRILSDALAGEAVADALDEPFSRALGRLRTSLQRYDGIRRSLAIPDPSTGQADAPSLSTFVETTESLLQRFAESGQPSPELTARLSAIRQSAETEALRIIPPAKDASTRAWRTFQEALGDRIRQPRRDPVVHGWAHLADATRTHDPVAAADAVAAIRELVASHWNQSRGIWETRLNHYRPFDRATLIYIAALLAVLVGSRGRSRRALVGGLILAVVAFLLHSGGLGARIVLHGRPPVTSLHSSALFIGWAAALSGLLWTIRQRAMGIPGLAALACAAAALTVANRLALRGDTLQPLQAVLDSNFWLSCHVLTITLGYTASFLAGFIALFHLLRTMRHRTPDSPADEHPQHTVFGFAAAALFFSSLGTLLGGYWADQTWGRFWGWDPKENGALLVVIWNALIVHARIGRVVGLRGLLALAIGGNIVTSWSWFGTNLLGIGLHAYGAIDGAFATLFIFWLTQLLAIAACGRIEPSPRT